MINEAVQSAEAGMFIDVHTTPAPAALHAMVLPEKHDRLPAMPSFIPKTCREWMHVPVVEAISIVTAASATAAAAIGAAGSLSVYNELQERGFSVLASAFRASQACEDV